MILWLVVGRAVCVPALAGIIALCSWIRQFTVLVPLSTRLKRVDNAFQCTIHWIVIYPVGSVIPPLNNWGQV